MRIVTVDFETYYADDYSLSSMQTDAYILDPRFEVIGVGVKVDSAPTDWFSGTRAEVYNWLHAIDWSDSAILAHHAQFDGFILTQHFDIRPKLWLDTLSMFRALYPYLPSASLAAMSAHLRLGAKGNEVVQAKNKRRTDFSSEELAAYGSYCRNDVELTYAAFKQMLHGVPAQEISIIDMNVRMFVEPMLQLDVPKLTEYRDTILATKRQLQEDSGFARDVLMSNDKFAEALRHFGIDPPMKVSKRTGKSAYAFAKTDEDFVDLLEYPDSRVQALVAARLGNKSTIAETRAEKFIETASRGRGFPIYLNYWGARVTGRDSGGNSINTQNLPSRGKDKVLREAIVAPRGFVIVVGDSSNIELRVNLTMSGHTDYLDRIRMYDTQGDAATSDLYCEFASELYGREILKENKLERTIGKIAELSLGYGAGAEAFRRMLFAQAGIRWELDQCQPVVDLYRERHPKVRRLWNFCHDTVIQAIASGNALLPVDYAGWFFTTDEGLTIINQLGIHYHNLRRSAEGEWEYDVGRKVSRLYGPKMVENMSQHAARHVVMWQAARFSQRYPVVLKVHDEIVSCVPEDQGDECAAYLLECLRTAPDWCNGLLPLNGEVGIGRTYAEAK